MMTLPSLQCYPICGDGILIEPEKCDDGNSISGDGCDSNCGIEEGFGPTGLETIPPIYKIESISDKNQKVMIRFSEKVKQTT